MKFYLSRLLTLLFGWKYYHATFRCGRQRYSSTTFKVNRLYRPSVKQELNRLREIDESEEKNHVFLLNIQRISKVEFENPPEWWNEKNQ